MEKLSLVERLKQRKENSGNISPVVSAPKGQKLSLAERIKLKKQLSKPEEGLTKESDEPKTLTLQQKLVLKET